MRRIKRVRVFFAIYSQAVEGNLSGQGSADVKHTSGYIFPEPQYKFGRPT
jgi:hypothetical protein